MALSAKDQAAVQKAAEQGLGKGAAANTAASKAIAAGNSATTPQPSPVATTPSNLPQVTPTNTATPTNTETPVPTGSQAGSQAFAQATNPTEAANPNIDTITDPVTGQSFSRDKTIPGSTYAPVNKYKQQLGTLQATGPAPADAGQAMTAIAQTTQKQTDTTAVDSFISQDPAVNTLMQGITKLLNPTQQTTSLMQDYQKLYKESGLDKINAEIIDADTVINGTESDIRTEIEMAGGFGTESQVQAMSLARNKSLIKRYNQLVQMKTDATNQLNTLSNLNAQDKQMAQQRIDSQINAMFKLADFRQQTINNSQEAFNNLVSQVGYEGAYNMYANNPRQLAYIEQVAGLGPGGLKSLASMPPTLDEKYKQAQIDKIYSDMNDSADTSGDVLAYTTALQAGNITLAQVPQKLRGEVLTNVQSTGNSKMLDLLGQYRDTVSGLNLFTSNFPGNKALLDTLKGQITAEYKQQKQLGTLDTGVQTLIDKIIPDPSKPSISSLSNKAQLDAIDRFIENQGGGDTIIFTD